MKALLLLGGVTTIGAGWLIQAPKSADVVVIIGGDSHGYLSPCGCTKPMSGGVRRRASAIRNLTGGKRSLILENGGLVHGIGRQDEIKAEALAESLKTIGADAIHLTSRETALGRGMVESIARLSGNKLVSSNLANRAGLPFATYIDHENFVVLGLSKQNQTLARDLRDEPVEWVDAVDSAIILAKGSKKTLVAMLEGSLADAEALAQIHPEIKLIVYQAEGDPESSPRKIGDRWLVSPGEKGKSVVRLRFREGKFDQYTVVPLSPQFADDRKVAGIYDRYLARVREEKLLDRLPRSPGPRFAGTATCGSCHADAMLAYEKSRHASALHTLEIEKHDRDPDCVGCHVVGLASENGFRSRKETPHLVDVGCESCHGAGAEHAVDPTKFPMAKVGEAACRTCHIPEHSPNFDFESFWKKIQH